MIAIDKADFVEKLIYQLVVNKLGQLYMTAIGQNPESDILAQTRLNMNLSGMYEITLCDRLLN
jgi:hypothetical protein